MVFAESKKEHYLTQLANGSAVVIADVKKDDGGSGEHFGPHDFLCAAYATCLNITIRMVLDRMSLKYDKVITEVELDRSHEDKTIFLYHADIIGDIDDETKEAVIAKSLRCPVKKTLSKDIDFQRMEK